MLFKVISELLEDALTNFKCRKSRTVDQIDPKEMILPLVVVDVHEEAAENPDYTLSLDRVGKWEKDHDQRRLSLETYILSTNLDQVP